MDNKTPRCIGCGRHPRDCWTMPCLVLEQALAKGKEKEWGVQSGLALRRP